MIPDNIFELYGEIKDDLKFITSSDIRVKIIISLNEGQKKLGDLKNEVHMRSSSILHSMSQLESRNLIIREFQSYSLSQTGEMVALNLIDLINSFSLMKKHEDFWLNHEINEIPENLINEINCLGHFKIIKVPSPNLLNQSIFNELLFESNVVKCIVSPLIRYEFLKAVHGKEDIQLILTDSALNEAIKMLNLEHITNKAKIESIEPHKIKIDLKLALIVTDNFLLLGLPQQDGKHDPISYLISETKDAIKWGNKLFSYYQGQAEKLK